MNIEHVYSFYTMHIAGIEQLTTLTERVFLQTSPTERGVSSQARLIVRLRCLLMTSIVWVGILLATENIHLAWQYFRLDLGGLKPSSQFGCLVLHVASWTVYIAMTLNYSQHSTSAPSWCTTSLITNMRTDSCGATSDTYTSHAR